MAVYIWCPACGCDVRDLLTQKLKQERVEVKLGQRDLLNGVHRVREVIRAMEMHALEKSGEIKSVADIYRLWSSELLAELDARFPARGRPPVQR